MKTQEYKERNPWPKFKAGDRVRFREDADNVLGQGTVLEVINNPPDKTGLVDTYVKIKWDAGHESKPHTSHLEEVPSV